MNAKDRVTCGVRARRRRARGPAGRPTSVQGWAYRALVGVVVTMLLAAATWAQTPPAKVIVDDVSCYGLRTIPTQRVMAMIKTRPGAEFSQHTVDEDVRRLVDSKLLYDVRPWKKDLPTGHVIVYFNCYEYPNLIREIVYKNAHHIKPDDLDALTGLRKGAPLNPAANRQACTAIQERYRADGRLFATCVLEEGGQQGDQRVVFNITEGPVVRIRSISCVGETFVGEQRLKTQINSSHSFLGMFGGKFIPAQVDADQSKLVDYYRTFGYLDCHVTRELRFSEDNSKVDVTFHIHEGQRYQVSRVFVEGVKSLDPSFVSGIPKLHQGEPFNKNTVERDQEAIKQAYGWRGREALLHENVTVDDQKPGFVQVRYEVVERPPARVGQVIIIGNEVTQDRVIRHEINLYPGQVLTYPELKLAERNLAKRNIFETNPETGVRPTVTVLDNDTDSEVKDILVNVKETHTGSLMFGIGVNSDAGLVGSIVLNERNFDPFRVPTSFADILEGRAFRGGGDEFRVEAVPGTQLQRYTVSFRDPYLFDSPYALGLSGYYFERAYNEYTEKRLGSRVTIDRVLNPIWTASAGFRVEDVRLSDISIFAPPEIANYAGDHFLFAPRIGIRRDTRDSYLRPTEGSVVEASFEEGLGDYTFPIFNLVGSKYWTVCQRPDGSGKQVLAYRGQVGIEGSNTPVYERFFAGGFQSIRGFEFRGVGPTREFGAFEIGGTFMLLNSLEYQIPVRANDALYFVAFVDSGTVEERVELKDYRVSAGVGARIVVPLLGPVPIALDFGFPIIKGPFDKEQVFSFWVGMFR